MNIDWSELLGALGGGASAVLILLLSGAVIALWRWGSGHVDARFVDKDTHAKELLETAKMMSQATDNLKSSVDAMRELVRARDV